MDKDKFLTVGEMADLLKVRPNTVRKWHQRGILPGYLISHHTLRFRWWEIERWLEKRKKGVSRYLDIRLAEKIDSVASWCMCFGVLGRRRQKGGKS